MREIPLTVLVDHEGRIAISHAGGVDPLVFEADINALFAEFVSIQLILSTGANSSRSWGNRFRAPKSTSAITPFERIRSCRQMLRVMRPSSELFFGLSPPRTGPQGPSKMAEIRRRQGLTPGSTHRRSLA
jgi:hypothetical protein